MTKDVEIIIRGTQTGPDSDGEPIETKVQGEYFFKNGKHYILYEELQEGDSHPTKNRMKFQKNVVELHKSGLLSVDMVFDLKTPHVCNYHTPYGSLAMEITTDTIVLAESDEEIALGISYRLSLNEGEAADCHISVLIHPLI